MIVNIHWKSVYYSQISSTPLLIYMEAVNNIAAPPKIKHPKELYSLSLVASLERFSYYGTTTLLLAYLVTQLHFKDGDGYGILGAFTALAYGLPLFCGVISDRLLGKRKSMVWGCLLHVIGLSCVAMPYHVTLFIGLAVFVTGNGFFGGVYKAMLGDFYDEKDTIGKDAGYTIMYGLFNVGIGLGAMICGYVGQEINWQLGFAIAAFGALLSFLSLVFGIGKQHGRPADMAKINRKVLPGINMEMLVYLLTLPAIGILILIFQYPAIMGLVLIPLAIVSFGYIVYLSFKYTKAERLKLFALLFGFAVWALYLSVYEQLSGSMGLFVIRNVDLDFYGVKLPGLALIGFLPSFFPAIQMPLLLLIWRKLSKAGREPGTFIKFVIGFLLLAALYGLIWWSCQLHSGTGMIPVSVIIVGIIIMEFGELCVGPIVYALTYKLSPVEIAGTTMGVLGMAAASGEWLAAKIGSLTSVPANITDPVKILPYYIRVYSDLALLSLGAAVLFLLLSPLMKKWMGDVR